MIRIKTPLLVLCAIALFSAPVMAGPLSPLAIDTTTYLGVWHGTTAYQGYFDPPFNTDPSGLTGYVDWAVYAPGTFPGGFSGYTPNINEFVYTYQVDNTGTAALSQLIVQTINTASNAGSFTGNNGFGAVAGVAPDTATATPFVSVEWTFFSNGVPSGSTSEGLAFSSPHSPVMASGVVIDDGTFAFVVPLPSSDGPIIPEPSTMVLASCGLAVLAIHWLRRRGRKEG
jgi:hypothetical protein